MATAEPESGSPQRVQDVAPSMAAAKSPAEVLEGADLSQPEIRALAVARIAEIQDAKQEAVFEKAARLGIPTRIDGPGRKVAILYDFRGDDPLYRTTSVWPREV